MKNILLVISILVSLNLMAQNEKPETLVVIHTTYGDITAKLYNDTPKHRDNFIKLVKEGWYNGSPFHRVIKDFMIQGGSNKDGRTDPGYRIDAEILPNHFHKKGVLSAARMGDQVNPKKESSGSQFYIVEGKSVTDTDLTNLETRSGVKYSDEQREVYKEVGGTPFLDQGYTVFGEVIEGLDVIDKIASVKTGQGDKPVENVTMKISILEEK